MVPSACQVRLWELAEWELDDPGVALRIAEAYVPGQVGLHDYLVITAPTLAQGLQVCHPLLGVVTTNYEFSLVEATEDEVTMEIRLIEGDGRGRQLAMQFVLLSNLNRARYATGAAVNASRVSLSQPAPRRHSDFVEHFGTAAIDFGAPADRITFRTADLALPLRTADPILAGLLQRYAGTLPQPTRPITWSQRLHELLTEMVGEGPVTVDRAARLMLTSRRSLQRRLAEEGTTWRRELDRARHHVLETATPDRHANRIEVAGRLGFSDARSLSRACRRWSASS